MSTDTGTLRLPEGTVTRFVGDVHLGDGGRNDVFGDKDETLVEFLRGCETSCDAVVFMGDTIDLPQGFSARRILRAHREVARALEKLTGQVQVVFIRGNHDWTVAYEDLFARSRACERLEIGDILAWHGHQFDSRCDPTARAYHASMVAHLLVERGLGFEFRTPLHDHYSWQNRLVHWLGHRYARFLRAQAAWHRRHGRERQAEASEGFIDYWSRSVWGDPHDSFRPAAKAVRGGPHRAIVCGHTHLPGVVELDGRHYVNAGSWAFGATQTAIWDGTTFTAHDIATGAPIRDEHYRWMRSGHDPGDFFTWWEHHHDARLRFGPPVPPDEIAATS